VEVVAPFHISESISSLFLPTHSKTLRVVDVMVPLLFVFVEIDILDLFTSNFIPWMKSDSVAKFWPRSTLRQPAGIWVDMACVSNTEERFAMADILHTKHDQNSKRHPF
jgi:hypothetical protein